MGEPNETRHIWLANEEAVISLPGQFIQLPEPAVIPLYGEWLAKTLTIQIWTG